MNNNEEQSRLSIFDGAKRLLQQIPNVAAGIIGLSGFAYIIGWVYAQSYFSVFGAKWLIADLPVVTIIGYSWWPVILLLFFAYLGITDLAEIECKCGGGENHLIKTTRGILNYGPWVLCVVIVADLTTGTIGYPTLARILSYTSMIIVIAMATSSITMLAFQLSYPSLHISLSRVYLTYAIICFGLYLAPQQMARNAALQDKNPEDLSLPFVVLRDVPAKEFRLLISSGERFYIFPTKYDLEYPPIQIVSAKQIQSIQKRIKHESYK